MTIDEQERNALAAIDLVREAVKPIAPDQWDGGGAETRGWVSAQRQDEVVAPLLAEHGLAIELVGTKLVNGTGLSTVWRWRHEGWRSETTTIETLIDIRGDLGATAATKAAVTSARRTYLEQLLGLRQAEDLEADLAREMDKARGVAFHACKRALRAYCSRYKQSEDNVIRLLTGYDPGYGVEATLEQLQAPMIASLWSRLLCHIPESSVSYDFGKSPKMADQLPDELGGGA